MSPLWYRLAMCSPSAGPLSFSGCGRYGRNGRIVKGWRGRPPGSPILAPRLDNMACLSALTRRAGEKVEGFPSPRSGYQGPLEKGGQAGARMRGEPRAIGPGSPATWRVSRKYLTVWYLRVHFPGELIEGLPSPAQDPELWLLWDP